MLGESTSASRSDGEPAVAASHGDRAGLDVLDYVDEPCELRDQLHEYHGVPLDRVLTHLGFDAGPGGPSIPPKDRRPGWRKVVLAKKSNDYIALFNRSELMSAVGRPWSTPSRGATCRTYRSATAR